MTILRHIAKVIRKRNQDPSYLIYYITNKCNMRCKHCFYWVDLNTPTDDLTVEELDKTTRNMGDLLHLIITGGEPYVRNDIDQVVDIFVRNTKVKIISIPSNGYFREKIIEKLEIILENHPDVSINQNISLDNIGTKHDEFRMTKDAYERATKTIQELHKLKEKFKNLSIGIIITFNSGNQDNFKEIIKTVFERYKPNNIAINLVRGNPKERVNLNLDIEKYREAVEFRDRLYMNKQMTSHNTFTFNKLATASRIELNKVVYKTYIENKFQDYCYAGNLQGVMYSNGEVYPCELLTEKLGNVREYDYNFRKLWLSKRAKEVVKFIKDSKCFCTHECFINTNILFNPKKLPRLINTAMRL